MTGFRKFTLLLAVLSAGLLGACQVQAVVPTPTTDPNTLPDPVMVVENPTEVPMGTLSGVVQVADEETVPQMAVYAVNASNPTDYDSIDLSASETNESPFTLQLPPGNYLVFGFANDGSGVVLAYWQVSESAAVVSVASGQAAPAVIVSSLPDGECEGFAVPAAPDDRFEGVAGPDPAVCAPTPTPPPVATIAPNAGRVAVVVGGPGATPATRLYFYSQASERWESFEVAADSAGGAEFVAVVPAGDYLTFAHATDGSGAYYGYSVSGTSLSLIKVRAGETTTQVQLKAPPTDECEGFALPATNDGQFAAVTGPDPNLCDNVSAGQGRVFGTIRTPQTLTPKTRIYLVNPSNGVWYTLGLAPEQGPRSFEMTIDAGTYQVFGWSDDGTQLPFAYYTSQTALGSITVGAGQTVRNVNLTTLPAGNCQGFALPASPDGQFPARPAPDTSQCDAAGNPIGGATGEVSGNVPASGAYTLYLRNVSSGAFETFALTSGNFSVNVAPGRYVIFAYDAANNPYGFTAAGRQALAEFDVYAGLKAENVNLRAPGASACAGLVLPATNDGKPALNTSGVTCDAGGYPIKAEGTQSLSHDSTLDLDTGTVTSGGDLRVRIVNGVLEIAPVNGAILAVMVSPNPPGFEGCGAVSQFGTAIADNVAVGTWYCVQTNQGRSAQVQLTAFTNQNATLSFRTWGQ